MVALFAVMWIFMIRPQKKRQLAQKQMLQSVGPGAEIVTAGGIYGTVVAADDDDVTLEIAPGTHVRVARRAIAQVISRDEEAEDEEYEEVDEDETVVDAYDEGDEVDEAAEIESAEKNRR
jgi:preprotein translocase subunit YajC